MSILPLRPWCARALNLQTLPPPFVILLTLLIAVSPVLAASFNGFAETPQQLSRNVVRLRISLSLDREVYLPEEIATASITITNPTNVPLVVPRPFETNTGSIVLAEKYPDGYWHTDEHWQPVQYDSSTPTITMAPNESKQLTFRLDAKAFNGDYAAGLGMSGMPRAEGRFRFNYMYTYSPEAAFFFRIREGDSVDHLVDVGVPTPSWAPPGEVSWYRQATVIRLDNEYAVCVTVRDTSRREVPLKRVGKRYQGGLGLMRRVATSTIPIVSLQAELDPLQRLAIRWTDGTNASRLVIVDLNLNVVQ